MKLTQWSGFLFLALLCMGVPSAWGATNYVNIVNLTPSSPFTTPETAATNIQDAIWAAASSNTILVSPGVYDTGGIFYESLTNRVLLSNSVIVMATSTNPADTLIVGAPDPATGTNGPGAIRCAFLKDAGCRLTGFTLTNGYTAWSAGTTNGVGGGVKGFGIASNCVIASCSALLGGGAYGSGLTLVDCRLVGNWASYGGSTYDSTLYNCVVTNGVALGGRGGGTYNGVISNTTIANCSGGVGAAVYGTTCRNSRITGCVGGYALWGGSLIDSVLSDCDAGLNGGVVSNSFITGILGNSAVNSSSIYNSTVSNCTVMNSLGYESVVYSSGVTNSIIADCLGTGRAVGGSTLRNCVVKNNRTSTTLASCTVWDSQIEGNSNTVVNGGVLTRCLLTGNNGIHVFRGAVMTNCSLVGNSGTSWLTLVNCLVLRNSTNATSEVYLFRPSTLINCTVVSNSAPTIFGAYSGLSSLTNCIVYHNSGKPFFNGTFVNYSCISSNVGVVGTGNTTNAPLFLDAAQDDYSLAGGVCVDTGFTLDWMTNTVDLTGHPRVKYEVVDMGAYEYTRRGSSIVFR